MSQHINKHTITMTYQQNTKNMYKKYPPHKSIAINMPE